MSDHKHQITDFIIALSEIPSSDLLVHAGGDHKEAIEIDLSSAEKFDFPLDSNWNQLLKTARQNKRESDLDSLCLVEDLVSWEYKGKQVQSPLFLIPIEWKMNKAKQLVEIRVDHESRFLNPFVKNRLIRDYELNSAENSGDFEVYLKENGVSADVQSWTGIGNFHHHRYSILRELELIMQAEKLSPLTATILGNESVDQAFDLNLSPGLLTPADADQLEVFSQIALENTVVQGPPGTGKSQVLVNLLGKRMAEDGLTLVVSEKRVALEVLVKKLTEAGLGHFAFLAHGGSDARDFVKQLEKAWLALEATMEVPPNMLFLSDQYKATLQLLLDKLNSPDLMSGLSFDDFRSWMKQLPEPNKFDSSVPSAVEWQAIRPSLEKLETEDLDLAIVGSFRKSLFLHAHPDQVIRRLLADVQFFKDQFDVSTLSELNQLLKDAARAQLVAADGFKHYFDLSVKPRERKRFDKARIAWNELSGKAKALEGERRIWKIAPSRTQAESWIELLNSDVKGWFKDKSGVKAVKDALADMSVDPKKALTNWLSYLDVVEQLPELERQFAEWGIGRPEVELDSVSYILRQLESEEPNELNRVANLPFSTRKELIANTIRLQRLLTDLEQCLSRAAEKNLIELLEKAASSVEQLASHIPALQQIPEKVFRLLGESTSLTDLDSLIIHSNWKLLAGQFPDLAAFDESQLERKLQAILEAEETEFKQFTEHLLWKRKVRFEHYSQLLRTPAAKLKGADKELKAQLKAGKSLLVREFGKTRQHASIRELLESEARVWIELLSPVWLSTPARVGDLFPMEKNLFDLVVFDEASQLPLPNALGALQRSKRALVAGDEQQMSPSAYFSGVKLSVDLLHQASWYWKKCSLKHHYRSEHPQLISFSNRHFYNNELLAYPGTSTANPMIPHWIEGAVYEDRMNLREAKAVADFLTTQSWKKSIGIVAFSEQQLQCIWSQCSPVVQEHISSGQEKGTVFFKALEQVQGDEADVLVISLGYGKDAEGNFHLRFGPLNRTDGHKRLNVLLTRAKTNLHFFSSVRSSDFAISANESVNLLRLFLSQLEQESESESLVLPYGLLPVSQKGKTLQLSGVYHSITTAQELSTFHRVMRSREWNLRY